MNSILGSVVPLAMFKQYPQVFVLFLLVLNLTTAEEEKVEEGGTGEERKDAIAKILSMDSDVFKNTVNGCIQKYCQWMYSSSRNNI